MVADKKGELDWKYWDRYRKYMSQVGFPMTLLPADSSTDRVLDLIGDPKQEGVWDRRGLVWVSFNQGRPVIIRCYKQSR